MEQRPELAAARQMTKVRQRELTKAWRGWSPAVSAFGSYDWDSGDLSEYEGSYFVGVQAEWEFFSGFQRSGEIAQAKAKWRAAAQEEQKALSDLRLDLRQAHYLAAEARQRLGVAGAALNSAGEALRITQVRYREGAASITELLVAEVGHTATVSREVAAYYDYLIALSNLKRAPGRVGQGKGRPGMLRPGGSGRWKMSRNESDKTGKSRLLLKTLIGAVGLVALMVWAGGYLTAKIAPGKVAAQVGLPLPEKAETAEVISRPVAPRLDIVGNRGVGGERAPVGPAARLHPQGARDRG